MNQQIEQTDLKRTMKSRHLFMIALGGVIGTGLFMGSGQIVHNAGPGGAILAFLVGGFVMYLTMLCLGELSVAMPEAGSFQSYASKFISPGFGFVVGWMYWLNWAVTVGVELTTVSILMKRLVSRRFFLDLVRYICSSTLPRKRFISKSICRSRVLVRKCKSRNNCYFHRTWRRCYVRSTRL